MKKHFILIASFVVSTAVVAQNSPSFGIRAGVTSSSIKGDAANSLNSLLDYTNDAIQSGSRTGFFAGGFTNIPLSDGISVEPGIYYAQKGYSLKGELNIKGAEFIGANAKAQLNSHYIDIPVVLKANMGGFQVFAGPQVSYLAKADLRTSAGVLGFNILNKTFDATSQFNRWDAAITGGVGYQFGNGFRVQAAYDHGLSRLNAGQSVEAYNRAVKVGVGYRF